MLGIDQIPTEVIFDWRMFLFLHPILPLEEQITPLDDPNLFPPIYGLRYDLPTRQSFILLDPSFRVKRMRWFFPYSSQYWASRTRELEIYATDLLPVDQDARDLRGDQRLACQCK